MTVRNLSPATQRSYISAVSKFSRYFGRSPDRLELEDVRAFQVHLVSTGISWPALNQIVCALRFFYGVTLGEALIPERIPYAREPRKLPVVLSADEVVQFLEAVSSLKSRAALTTAYAAGLRASEVAGLRIEDIDSARGVIQVRHGKGAKDRNVMLSPQLLGILRTYWRLARPRLYLSKLKPDEFIRRFLLHTLPDGFHRIRHFGFMANGHRAAKLALCRKLLNRERTAPNDGKPSPVDSDALGWTKVPACPDCGGVMRIIERFRHSFSCSGAPTQSYLCDTS